MRRRGAPVDGVLLLDKPVGITSNAALQRAKRAIGAARAGHVGTLDPLASGLLPVCFGEATKFSQGLTDADKTYRATIRLGQRTTTGDAEGEIVAELPVTADAATVGAAVASLQGPLDQVPPMYSALKHHGKPLYAYARAGETVERAARSITIHAIDLEQWAPPAVIVRVHCSKGTYVRTLAETLGERLGCGAHLAGLRRLAVGGLGLDTAITLADWEVMATPLRVERLLPPDRLVDQLPKTVLDTPRAACFRQGQTVALDEVGGGAASTRVYAADGGAFIGLGARQADGLLKPLRLVAIPPGTLATKNGDSA
ncbi:MAG: tRNA pseudouridine(55) synthase TruB [Burkholderiales bacterium]